MDRRTFRILLSLGLVAIIGLIATQIYWLDKAVTLKEAQFDAKIRATLAAVAQRLRHQANTTAEVPIQRVQDFHYMYIVYLNEAIDPNLLSYHLKAEFTRHDIKRDFVYTLYDCASQTQRCQDYVVFNKSGQDLQGYESREVPWPQTNADEYYFAVYFPDRDGLVLSGLGIWAFSSLAIVFVAGFFAYAVYELMRQRRLSEIQRDFIDAMTHEFKTPLQTISLVGDAIANPKLATSPGQLDRYAGILRQEVNRLRDHVDTILTNAKDYERAPDLRLERFEVRPMLVELESAMQDRFAANDMHLLLDCPPDAAVVADKVHLRNMITTLLDNTLKYAGAGATVTIQAKQEPRHTRISVADTGQGIEPRVRRWVGHKFYRAQYGADGPKGFGLGLFYVKNMMRSHQGRFKVESQRGQGTRVSLVFPLS